MVELMVLIHKYLPLVNIFIFAITKAFVNCPQNNAIQAPTTTLGTCPNTKVYASLAVNPGAGGNQAANWKNTAVNIVENISIHVARLACLYPYTSVRTSPNI